jgi:hypothetical protein
LRSEDAKVRERREGEGAIATDFSVAIRNSWVAQFGPCTLILSMEPGERRQRGSTETTKAVADADHGIADQEVFRGMIAAATRERLSLLNIVGYPGGVRRGRAGAEEEG